MARSWKNVKTDVHAQGLIEPAQVVNAKLEIEGALRAHRLAQVHEDLTSWVERR